MAPAMVSSPLSGSSLPTMPSQTLPEVTMSPARMSPARISPARASPARLSRGLSEGAIGCHHNRRHCSGTRRANCKGHQLTDSRSPTPGFGTVSCYGKYCNAEICYPASLMDIESSDDPWMVQARELCKKEWQCENGRRYTLLEPEEMVACLQSSKEMSASLCKHSPKRSAQRGPLGSICMSWILDAQNYPSLCDWLGNEKGWMFDPQNIDCVLKATEQIRVDDERNNHSFTRPKESFHLGFHNRLRPVPVCGKCLCIYTVIHTVVTKVRTHRLDLWANREQQRQRKHERKSTKNKGHLHD